MAHREKNLILSFKLLATVLVAAALTYPCLSATMQSGVFASVNTIGLTDALVLGMVFLAAVAFYCRALQRCLQLIRPEARAANPKSVWLMFLIPYNFVEDFFIIHHVTQSLRAEANNENFRLTRFKGPGAVSGFGWCTTQIVSLLPSHIGEAASIVALVFWVVHWRFIVKTNKLLMKKTTGTASASKI